MSKKHTGLVLSEARGPLNNLLDNLSGENGEYWLEALKKLLRKEELPKMPTDLFMLTKALDSKQTASEKINEWVQFFNSIPCVYEAHECDDEDLIDICISPNLAHFLHPDEMNDTALFTLGIDLSIRRIGYDDPVAEITDDIFNKWCKNKYDNIYTFYKALLELCEMYENAVPLLVK
jgi:hypothetical protein